MKDINLRHMIPLLSVLTVVPGCSDNLSNMTPEEKVEMVSEEWCESALACDDEFYDEFDSVDDCVSYIKEDVEEEDSACIGAIAELWKCHSYHYSCTEYDEDACPTESEKVDDLCYDDYEYEY